MWFFWAQETLADLTRALSEKDVVIGRLVKERDAAQQNATTAEAKNIKELETVCGQWRCITSILYRYICNIFFLVPKL